jgi:nucleotide-binding universal stress UspA family protein
MLPIRTILHPTDFSPQSAAGYQMACALARDYGARLVLLHVHPVDMVYGEGYVLPPDPAAILEELRQELDRMPPPDPGVRVDRAIEDGDPVTEILETARETGCDLIVMGTHGRTGVGRLLLGSVAEAVLRKAPCPVLTMKASPPAHGAVASRASVAQPVVDSRSA